MKQWVFAIYLEMTSLKGVTSIKLARDIGVTQKTAWFMLCRIREAWGGLEETMDGPVEADETCMGGWRANMSKAKRKELAEADAGRDPGGKVFIGMVGKRLMYRRFIADNGLPSGARA